MITDQLASAVNDGSKYLSIMIDGATDSSGIENETVHCRFVKDGQPVNHLVGRMAMHKVTFTFVKIGLPSAGRIKFKVIFPK